MSYSVPLERAFLAKELSRDTPSALRVVGTLLDSAFEPAPRNREIERLCAILDKQTRH